MPKVNHGFNKYEYDQAYTREHYKKLTAAFTKAEAERVEAAADKAGLTKSAYIKNAVFEKMEREGQHE